MFCYHIFVFLMNGCFTCFFVLDLVSFSVLYTTDWLERVSLK